MHLFLARVLVISFGHLMALSSRSTIGGIGDGKFVPVLGGDGAKTASPGDIFDQPPGELS